MVGRYADRMDVHRDRMTAQLINQVTDALKLDVRTITRAERLRTAYWHRVRAFLARYDYILTPTVSVPAFGSTSRYRLRSVAYLSSAFTTSSSRPTRSASPACR